MSRAACLGMDPELFYPEQDDFEGRDAALAVCHSCPIEAQCLAENLTSKWGVVGGTTADERKRMREGPKERNCTFCGEPFISTRGRKLCSESCRYESMMARKRKSA